MNKNDPCYASYVQILREELVPAMGCTEPIAIAYAAARARQVLDALPERMEVAVSGNIIKNVKSVVVPNTRGMKGIEAAAAAGAARGDADAELEVLARLTAEDAAAVGYHTNIVSIRRNGETLLEKEQDAGGEDSLTDRSCLCVEKIVDFADSVVIDDVREILKRQIAYNMAIAEEGLRGGYGANIGKTLLHGHENDLGYMLRAWAAAGSDARMNGCELPVIINSGSGNQGITTSVPVIVFARERGASEEELLRALTVSNLVTIHLKTGIGRLSAYCGAVSAGAGAASGIAYLQGGRFETIAHVIVNTVAVTSGIVCDGAKASCAAKIAAAVDAGLLGLAMVRDGNEFYGGDGIVKKGVENTIAIVGRLARNGMLETDREIIRLMLE